MMRLFVLGLLLVPVILFAEINDDLIEATAYGNLQEMKRFSHRLCVLLLWDLQISSNSF